MKLKGYRIFKLNGKIPANLDPVTVTGLELNKERLIPTAKLAESVTLEHMENQPTAEFVILPVYKAK